MCLTIPKQVISVKKDSILLQAGRKKESAGTLLKVKKGDWVLTQNNVIISKINKKQAQEINKLTRSVILTPPWRGKDPAR